MLLDDCSCHFLRVSLSLNLAAQRMIPRAVGAALGVFWRPAVNKACRRCLSCSCRPGSAVPRCVRSYGPSSRLQPFVAYKFREQSRKPVPSMRHVFPGGEQQLKILRFSLLLAPHRMCHAEPTTCGVPQASSRRLLPRQQSGFRTTPGARTQAQQPMCEEFFTA